MKLLMKMKGPRTGGEEEANLRLRRNGPPCEAGSRTGSGGAAERQGRSPPTAVVRARTKTRHLEEAFQGLCELQVSLTHSGMVMRAGVVGTPGLVQEGVERGPEALQGRRQQPLATRVRRPE